MFGLTAAETGFRLQQKIKSEITAAVFTPNTSVLVIRDAPNYISWPKAEYRTQVFTIFPQGFAIFFTIA